jgi:hypothetical protein
MFHAWFDGAVPGAALLQGYNGGELLRAPRDVVAMYVDGKPRSYGAENTTLLVLRDLGRSARQLLPENDSETAQHADCYCGAALLGSTFFTAAPVRQAATAYLAERLCERFRLPRHGTPRAEVIAAIRAVEMLGPADGQLWETACAATTGATDAVRPLQDPPRLLLLVRKSSRRLGNIDEIVAMARAIGFCVLPFASEDFSATLQFRTARAADMIAGVHGQGLTWMIAVDSGSVRPGPSCRRVLEFQHWGRKLLRRNDVYVMLSEDLKLVYRKLVPVRVEFGPTVSNPHAERKAMLKAVFPYDFKGFYDQTVFFDLTLVRSVLKEQFAALVACLNASATVRT